MVIYILIVLLASTTYVVGDAQLHPIKTQDLQRIVDSVKKDVDRHLKMTYAGRHSESISPLDSKEFAAVVKYTENEKKYKEFMKMIQDSMHHHLVKNLGQPPDADSDGSTVYMKPTPESTSTLFSTENISEQTSKSSDKNNLESSAKVDEIRVGSTKGLPGVHFPDYTDIPITSFTCSEKPYFPGFYADLDTGCQVFHVCWPDRRESFLCPMGTTFNQAFKVCDYWYNSNCSLAPYYYTVNAEVEPDSPKAKNESTSFMINTLLEKTDLAATQSPDSSPHSYATPDSAVPFISQFIPIKAKIVVYPKTASQRLKIVTTASIGEGKKSDFKQKPNQNSYASKLTRVPRSLELTKSKKDANTGKLPFKRHVFRIYEALDRAVIDIKNDETLSRLSGYAESAAKDVKSIFSFFIDEPLEDICFEPGSELYEADMENKRRHGRLHEVWKAVLILLATLEERHHQKEMRDQHEVSKDSHEHDGLKPEPLTNLNPRFIVKPAIKQISSIRNSELPTLNRAKRSATINNPSKLSHEDRLNIHPETKKTFLKNYMKLYKAKA